MLAYCTSPSGVAMHRILALAAAIIVAGPAAGSGSAQIATPINERTGLFSCRCTNGRIVPPVMAPGVAEIWREFDSLNRKLSALSRRMERCLSDPPRAGSYQDRQCDISASEKASIERQLAKLQSQAGNIDRSANRLCAAACMAAPAQTTAPASGQSAGRGTLPVGNDWSLDNTISGLRPISGLSPIQRKWAEETARARADLKPLGGPNAKQTRNPDGAPSAAGSDAPPPRDLPDTTKDQAKPKLKPLPPIRRGNATWVATEPSTPSRTTAPGSAPPAGPADPQTASRPGSVADPARPPERTPQTPAQAPAPTAASQQPAPTGATQAPAPIGASQQPVGLSLPAARSMGTSDGRRVVDLSGVPPGSVIRNVEEPPDTAAAPPRVAPPSRTEPARGASAPPAERRTTTNSAGEPAPRPLPATGGAAGSGPPRKRPGPAAGADDEYGRNEEERAAMAASNMVPAHLRGLCEVARDRGEYLVFQKTSPAARLNLERGYLPKPLEVKVKTAPDDGGPAPGLIPIYPENNGRAGDPKEYKEQIRKYLARGPMDSDPLARIVALPDAQNPKRSVYVLADYKTGKPFTADYDLATVGRPTLSRVIQHDVEGQLTPEDRALLRDIERKLGIRVAQHGPATMAPTVKSAEIKYPLTVCDPTGRVSTIQDEAAFRALAKRAAATGHTFWGWRWRADEGEPDAEGLPALKIL